MLVEKGIVLSSALHGNRRKIWYFNTFMCMNQILICWLLI